MTKARELEWLNERLNAGGIHTEKISDLKVRVYSSDTATATYSDTSEDIYRGDITAAE